MKNDFCDLPRSQIMELKIPDEMIGFLLSPFQFSKQNGLVLVPEESFKEMIDFITQYALLKDCVEPKWAKMDPAWVVEFVRTETSFDADKVEKMLQFATDAAKDAGAATTSATAWIDEMVAEKLPNLRAGFVEDVKSMSREELQRRLLIASDWAGVWSDSLDGIPEIRCIPGGGSDGTRMPNNVQAIVRTLVKECPLTFQQTYTGQLKAE